MASYLDQWTEKQYNVSITTNGKQSLEIVSFVIIENNY